MKNYPLYETTYYRDLSGLLTGAAKRYGEAPAVTCYSAQGTKQTNTYRKLQEDAEKMAHIFLHEGICGKRIAIAGENSYEWLLTFFAAGIAGNTLILIDIEQPAETIETMILYADTDILFVSKSMKAVTDEIKTLERLIVFELGGQTFPSLCEKGTEGVCRTEKAGGEILVYTSGTTAEPKAVELSCTGILKNAAESIAMVKGTDRVFTALPFYHVYGLTCGVLANLIAGAHIGINGELKTMLRDLAAFHPGTVMAVPLLAEQLCRMLCTAAQKEGRYCGERKKSFFSGRKAETAKPEMVQIKEELLGDVTLLICGGAHLPGHIGNILTAFGILVLQGYGVTECSPLVSVNRNMANKMDSVGLPLPGYEIKIAEDGEVLVRGECLMRGYYKQKQATGQAFSEEWFKTGDIGEVDRQGYLKIIGRSKNLIVMKNGKKILPEEIESYLEALPLIESAVVYGAATGGETDDVRIAASIYPNPEMTAGMATYETLAAVQKEIEKVNKRLPLFKQVQIVNISEIRHERTTLGKAKRDQ